jgi:hypothetical protein
MKRNMLVSLVFATVLFAIPALGHAQVIINLRTGTVSGASPGVTVGPVQNQGPMSTCAAGNWWKGFVTVDLNPALGSGGLPRTAFFTVEYEGTPSGWGVDIGDSSTDDGYGGGDVGDPSAAAEVQVVGQTLAVYNFDRGVGVENLLTQQLNLTNGSLKFGVADQTLAVGQPRTILATPVTKTLFTIPDTYAGANQWKIYAGFNHVVKPTTNRYGCGVRFVTIWTSTNPPGV